MNCRFSLVSSSRLLPVYLKLKIKEYKLRNEKRNESTKMVNDLEIRLMIDLFAVICLLTLHLVIWLIS